MLIIFGEISRQTKPTEKNIGKKRFTDGIRLPKHFGIRFNTFRGWWRAAYTRSAVKSILTCHDICLLGFVYCSHIAAARDVKRGRGGSEKNWQSLDSRQPIKYWSHCQLESNPVGSCSEGWMLMRTRYRIPFIFHCFSLRLVLLLSLRHVMYIHNSHAAHTPDAFRKHVRRFLLSGEIEM